MKSQTVDPIFLHANPWNTNHVAPEEREKLKASIERHGWVKPILVREIDGDLQILGGAHRVEIAVEMGITEIPVWNLGEIDEAKAKEIGLIDNARYGQDDATALSALLHDLGGAQAMAEFLPIGEAELAALSTEIDDDDIDDLLEGDDTPDPDDKPVKPTKTHQTMRFRVSLADADRVQACIERVMEDQGFTEEDSLTNAGDALVHIIGSLSDE